MNRMKIVELSRPPYTVVANLWPAGQTLTHKGFLNDPRVDFYKLIFYIIKEETPLGMVSPGAVIHGITPSPF